MTGGRVGTNVPADIRMLLDRANWIDGYSGPQKVDHSGHLHLLRLFPSQPP